MDFKTTESFNQRMAFPEYTTQIFPYIYFTGFISVIRFYFLREIKPKYCNRTAEKIAQQLPENT